MHQIPCSSCGQTVEIASGSATCSNCGEDLTALIPNEGSSRYYYARAEKLVEQNQLENAMAVADEGLQHAMSSDLLLLAALLAEKLERFDRMRRYVSQIPLDDSLRAEGEWLLRAHQNRQQARRLNFDPANANRVQDVRSQHPTNGATDNPQAEDIHRVNHVEPQSQNRSAYGWLALLIPLVALVWAGWLYRSPVMSLADSIISRIMDGEMAADNLPANSPSLGNDDNGSGSAGTTSPADAPGESGSPAVLTNEEEPTPTATLEPPQIPTSTPISELKDLIEQAPGDNQPLASVSDTVNQSDESERQSVDVAPVPLQSESNDVQLADADIGAAVVASRISSFDVLAFLRDIGRPDLAELPLDAQLQDGTLTVFGIVSSFQQRADILELLQLAEAVNSINDVGLVIRLEDTYRVQEGDTLWLIAYQLYGDGSRWREIYDFNQASLASPEALIVGQVLNVPTE